MKVNKIRTQMSMWVSRISIFQRLIWIAN